MSWSPTFGILEYHHPSTHPGPYQVVMIGLESSLSCLASLPTMQAVIISHSDNIPK